jgi:hypothetical protein
MERVVCNHSPRLDRGIDWTFPSAPDKRVLLSLSGMRGAWRSIMRWPTVGLSMRRLSSWDLAGEETGRRRRRENDLGEVGGRSRLEEEGEGEGETWRRKEAARRHQQPPAARWADGITAEKMVGRMKRRDPAVDRNVDV